MKVSDYIIEFLYERGTREIFGFAGGAIIHLIDSIYKHGMVKYITTYHEQTAAIAAEGYSWGSEGKIGVAMATSGPGATNLITGIADAFFDSIPVLYITGQVNTDEYKYKKKIRQQGFQETDIVSIVKPITKFAALVDDSRLVKHYLEKAWYEATSGRKGPVLLDIPMDIQRADIDVDGLEGFVKPGPQEKVGVDWGKIGEMITSATRPIILVGAGCRNSKVLDPYINGRALPVVYSLMGKGSIPDSYEHCLGMIGSYGIRSANIVLENADLVLVLGSRLDTRQTGINIQSFISNKKRIIRVDIDLNELNEHRLAGSVYPVNLPVDDFLSKAVELGIAWNLADDWLAYIKRIRGEYGLDKEIEKNIVNKKPYGLMRMLNKSIKGPVLFCADIGHNQMFAAQGIRIERGQEFKTSGGLAPMGFSLPFSIGYSFSTKIKAVSINGDGGLHISVQSLMLLSQYNLPVKVVVLNNRSLGMITQFQNQYFDNLKYGTIEKYDYRVPRFESLAAAYGLRYFKYDFLNDDVLEKILQDNLPCLIEVDVGDETLVFPKLEVNMPIGNPNPKLDDLEYGKTRYLP
jgi:acetolactate synthase-1/2/3 large subunit